MAKVKGLQLVIVIGTDAHKRTHTMAGVDSGGRQLGVKTVEATTAGHLAALRWAYTEFGRDIVWAVEDTRSLTARLERDLMNAGHRVIRVPPQLMARTRKSGRSWGKSDPIDALAVARAVLREPDLPVAVHDSCSREINLLVERRDDLIHYRTGMIQRLLWRIHELDPTYRLRPGALVWRPQQEALSEWLAARGGLVAEIARDELTDVITVTPTINALEKRLAGRVRSAAPSLLALPGCGALTAARIIGDAADVSRFKNEAAFASYAGLAPRPNWSGPGHRRYRSSKSGNRALNGALHQIAMIQIKRGGVAETYYRRRRAEHDTHSAAMLHIKRRVVRTVFNRLRADRKDASFDALLAVLENRAAAWAALVGPAPPAGMAPRNYDRTVTTAMTTPPVSELQRRANEWKAALIG